MEVIFAKLLATIFWGTIVGLLAKRKNLNPWGWGIAGALSWGIAIIALMLMPYKCPKCDKSLTNAEGKSGNCPKCGEFNSAESNTTTPYQNNYSGVGVCKHCGVHAGIFNLTNGICPQCRNYNESVSTPVISSQAIENDSATPKRNNSGIGVCKQCGTSAGVFNIRNGLCPQCKKEISDTAVLKNENNNKVFGFFKKRLRKENLKLISECSQMARRLHRLYEGYGKVMGDPESIQMTEHLVEVIEELNEVEAWLDHNETLSPQKADDYLRLYSALAVQVDGMEKGKDAFRKKFEQKT